MASIKEVEAILWPEAAYNRRQFDLQIGPIGIAVEPQGNVALDQTEVPCENISEALCVFVGMLNCSYAADAVVLDANHDAICSASHLSPNSADAPPPPPSHCTSEALER